MDCPWYFCSFAMLARMVLRWQVELLFFPPCYRRLLAFILLIQNTPQRHACNSLLVCSVVGIKEFLITLLPRSFQVRMRDIPIGSTFSENRTQILAEIFDCGSAKEPVAVVDLVNDETRFKHDRVWDHRIVQRIRVPQRYRGLFEPHAWGLRGKPSGRQLRCEIHWSQ
jgi:hypothetical protein